VDNKKEDYHKEDEDKQKEDDGEDDNAEDDNEDEGGWTGERQGREGGEWRICSQNRSLKE